MVTIEEQHEMARRLVDQAREFSPNSVYYVETGGHTTAEVLGEALGIPKRGIDLRYPLSRIAGRGLSPLKIILFPFKEIAYRLTNPSGGDILEIPEPGTRILLVDDSASSGRTLEVAIRILADCGLDRKDIFVAVLRCGARASGLVDARVTGERIVFQRDRRMKRFAT